MTRLGGGSLTPPLRPGGCRRRRSGTRAARTAARRHTPQVTLSWTVTDASVSEDVSGVRCSVVVNDARPGGTLCRTSVPPCVPPPQPPRAANPGRVTRAGCEAQHVGRRTSPMRRATAAHRSSEAARLDGSPSPARSRRSAASRAGRVVRRVTRGCGRAARSSRPRLASRRMSGCHTRRQGVSDPWDAFGNTFAFQTRGRSRPDCGFGVAIPGRPAMREYGGASARKCTWPWQ